MNIRKMIRKIRALSLAGLLMISTVSMTSLAEGSTQTTTKSSASVTVPIEVAVNGDIADSQKDFTIVLTSEDGQNIIDSKTTKGGTFEFELEYTSPGVHNYIIKQKGDGASQVSDDTGTYTYDTTTYMVKVTVVNENGVLKPILTVREKDQQVKRTEIVFTNRYTKSEKPTDDEETPKEEEGTPPGGPSETPSPSEPSETPKQEETPSPSEPSETPKQEETPASSEPDNSTPSSDESSSDEESSSTTESSTTPTTESSTTPETPVTPTPNTPVTPNTPQQTTESPNSEEPRTPREEVPEIPRIEELVAEPDNPEYVNLAPDPVPLVSMVSLNDEEVPKAVLIADEDVPLAVLTGDAFNMILWIALLAGSAIAIIGVLVMKLKDRKNNK